MQIYLEILSFQHLSALIITPDLFFVMKGRTALVHRKEPFRLISIVLSHSSSEVSINFLTYTIPALLTKISIDLNISLVDLRAYNYIQTFFT